MHIPYLAANPEVAEVEEDALEGLAGEVRGGVPPGEAPNVGHHHLAVKQGETRRQHKRKKKANRLRKAKSARWQQIKTSRRYYSGVLDAFSQKLSNRGLRKRTCTRLFAGPSKRGSFDVWATEHQKRKDAAFEEHLVHEEHKVAHVSDYPRPRNALTASVRNASVVSTDKLSLQPNTLACRHQRARKTSPTLSNEWTHGHAHTSIGTRRPPS